MRGAAGPRETAEAMAAMDKVGPYNIYNIYDTCGSGNMSAISSSEEGDQSKLMDLLGRDGDQSALFSDHRHRIEDQDQSRVTGGPPYSWRCGMGAATNAWMNNALVRKAIHVPDQEFYGGQWPSHGMDYSTYTHASLDLYPSLLSK